MKQKRFTNRRYLAVWLPYLSTDRIGRHDVRDGRKPDERPLVVVAKKANALRLVGVSPEAVRLGLVPELAFADAKARVPRMRVVDHDPDADKALLGVIADWCDRYTPVLQIEEPDGLVLEISGTSHLFGGEQSLADDLAARLGRAGLETRIAIAGTPQAARAFCRFGQGGVVPEGKEAQRAAMLSVEALEVDDKTLIALRRAGLSTLEELMQRPRKPLAVRFSTALTWKLAQVLGEIDQPITPRRPVPLFHAEMRFADPVGSMGAIEAALEALCRDLCVWLEREGQGGRHFQVSFFRADGAIRRLEVFSGQPLRHAGKLSRLIGMRLDALADPLDPGFGFDMIRLAALAGDSAPPAQNWLDGNGQDEQEVRDLLDRLTARFGANAVQKVIPQNSHLPERAFKAVPALSKENGVGLWQMPRPETPPHRPLFLFTPPEKVEVIAEIPEGPPRRFRWRGTLYDVAFVEGPERVAPEWWRATMDRLTRDYFKVEDEGGRRFWLFRYGLYEREPESGRWYIHGLFP